MSGARSAPLLKYKYYGIIQEENGSVKSETNIKALAQAYLFVAAAQAGVKSDDEPKYNDWAFYAVMNMIWSDYWGALLQFVPQDEVRICAELAKAALCDRDHRFNARRYFDL